MQTVWSDLAGHEKKLVVLEELNLLEDSVKGDIERIESEQMISNEVLAQGRHLLAQGRQLSMDLMFRLIKKDAEQAR